MKKKDNSEDREAKNKMRFLKDLKKVQQATEDFWTEIYPQKTWEEKLNYWQNNLEKAILEQEKQDLPPFSVFDANWYASVQEQEAKIEKIIQSLFDGPWAKRDANAFWNAVKQA